MRHYDNVHEIKHLVSFLMTSITKPRLHCCHVHCYHQTIPCQHCVLNGFSERIMVKKFHFSSNKLKAILIHMVNTCLITNLILILDLFLYTSVIMWYCLSFNFVLPFNSISNEIWVKINCKENSVVPSRELWL